MKGVCITFRRYHRHSIDYSRTNDEYEGTKCCLGRLVLSSIFSPFTQPAELVFLDDLIMGKRAHRINKRLDKS